MTNSPPTAGESVRTSVFDQPQDCEMKASDVQRVHVCMRFTLTFTLSQPALTHALTTHITQELINSQTLITHTHSTQATTQSEKHTHTHTHTHTHGPESETAMTPPLLL